MLSGNAPCTVRHLDHVCIAVKDIEETIAFYKKVFDITADPVEDISDQGVKGCLMTVGTSRIELIEPTDPNGGIARFIERKGEGLHHVALQVENIQEKLNALASEGVELIDKEAREGLSGTIAFLHPRATRGVLIELVEKQ
ncbi:methylmalonyl-CoA epimerase [SAR202 cluster bacterium AD-802-E10_MRT_200m]|nr:methylmalonyl-CoA epimerase [SAR202 cluster bacterium AD-802-E10_MRT_200m]